MFLIKITLLTVFIFSQFNDISSEDYYSILGVNKFAEFREIRKAYKKLALINHPDKNKSNKTAHDKFLEITKAYEVLRDPETRRQYDLLGKTVEFSKKQENRWTSDFQDFTYFTSGFGFFDDDALITILTDGDFYDYVRNDNGVWFIFFYNPHCEKCQAYKDIWRQISVELEDVIHIAAVNCKEDFTLCSKLSYVHVPKFVLFTNGLMKVFQMNHDDSKTFQDLVDFVMLNIISPLTTITPSMWRAGKQTQWVLSLCQNKEKIKNLIRLSIILENIVSVGTVQDEELCNEIYTDYRQDPLIFWQSRDREMVQSFAVQALKWDRSRLMADQVLSMLPDPITLDVDSLLDHQMRISLGSDETWLVCFHSAPLVHITLELKRLPALLPNVKIGTLNCLKYNNFCQQLQIHIHYQWIILQRDSKLIYHFGHNTVKDVAEFVQDCVKGNYLISLDEKEFRKEQDSGESIFVVYTSWWCSSCMNLLSTLRRSNNYFKAKNIKVAIIECSSNQEMCHTNNIRNYPTIQFYKQGQMYHFFAPYNIKTIMDFTNEMISPFVKYIDDKNIKLLSLKNQHDIWIVLYFSPLCPACHKLHNIWRNLASELCIYHNTYVAEIDCNKHPLICQERGITFYPSVHLYPTGSSGLNTYAQYSQDHNLQSIINWLKHFIHSPVKHILPNDLQTLVKSFVSALVLYYDSFEEKYIAESQKLFTLAEEKLLPHQIEFFVFNCNWDSTVCKDQIIITTPQLILYDYGTKHAIKSELISDIADEIKSLIYLPTHDEL